MKKIILIFFALVLIVGLVYFQNNKITKKDMEYLVTLETSLGDIKIKTYNNDAPNTVDNFIKLASEGFYDNTIFHRVIAGFMIQGGDPTGTGMGGPGYSFNDEINSSSDLYQRGYKKGVVAMANAGPNTQGSQFFIMVSDYPLLPNYTIFGEVVSGQEVADRISMVQTNESDRPIENIVVEKVSVLKNN